MLTITVPAVEGWDENREEFVTIQEQTLCLEHSLISISKWESKWHKPFLSDDLRTDEESIDYVRCMTLNKNVDPNVYYMLTKDNVKQIHDYIENPMTATTFNNLYSNQSKTSKRTIVTNELIYYWMLQYNIPFKCEKWHINRLLTLIRVCEVKNSPAKKMSKRDLASRYAEINAANRKKFNSKG